MLDELHPLVFQTINDLFQAIQEKKREAKLLPIFQTLVRYTQTHFRDENALPTQVKFSRLREHVTEHQQMIRKTGEYYQQFKDRALDSVEMLKFLKVWWVHHITVSDMQFAPLFKRGA